MTQNPQTDINHSSELPGALFGPEIRAVYPHR